MVVLFRSLEIFRELGHRVGHSLVDDMVKDGLFETFHGTRQCSSSVVFLNPFLPGNGVPLFCHLCDDVTEGAILKQF